MQRNTCTFVHNVNEHAEPGIRAVCADFNMGKCNRERCVVGFLCHLGVIQYHNQDCFFTALHICHNLNAGLVVTSWFFVDIISNVRYAPDPIQSNPIQSNPIQSNAIHNGRCRFLHNANPAATIPRSTKRFRP
jgi:hypothetical protein